jgi:hypothetical protein
MPIDKDIAKRLRELQREGWKVVDGHRHGLLISPDGVKVTFSSSASDRNAIRRFNKEIERVKNGENRKPGHLPKTVAQNAANRG